MDFADKLKQFSSRVEKLKDQIPTEEATKMSLIIPFFQMLGYDVFNPDEFLPEYTADVGIKKGEKVDYAILKDGNPVILIEAKWCGENLDRHSSQLFRYFGTTQAKFAILTNGICYKFFTDLDEQNKMDIMPFLEFDILNTKDNIINEIKKFHKDNFDIDNIFSTASELKYSKAIKEFMAGQLKAPSDDFIRFVLSDVYEGTKTQNVINKFRDIVKKALNEFISEMMNDKIKSALKSEEESDEAVDRTESEEVENESNTKIVTTLDEIEAYYAIKSMLVDVLPCDSITYKDTETYMGILYKNNTRKWICRLYLDGHKKAFTVPGETRNGDRYSIEDINDLYNFKDILIEAAKRYAEISE